MKQLTETWRQYENGKAYQSSMGFTTSFPAYQRFKEGDQWPAATADNVDFPRPVFNMVDMFIRTKRSAIVNQNIILNYSCAESYEDDTEKSEKIVKAAKDYTDFAALVWKNCEQDRINNDLLDDAATLGTGVVHYYWDSDIYNSGSVKSMGDIRGDVIDPLNIFFGNPQCADVQKQPYIIIVSRELVSDVKKIATMNGADFTQLSMIKGDNDTRSYDSEQYENMGDKITVLTKYVRRNGEIYFSKSTKNVEIIKNRPLTPSTAKNSKITLYPVVVFNWKRRKHSIFGIGDAQELISINKAYNVLKAYSLYSVQQMGNPKIIRRANAIQEPITSEPGQVLTDRSSDGSGIRYLNPPNFSNFAGILSSEIFEMARTVNGVTQVNTGEIIGQNMAASAIIALQNQAKTPIKEIQNKFYTAIEHVGKIWEQFFKTYYSLPRIITTQGDDAMPVSRSFTGSDYSDMDFKLVIDVGTASDYGEELSIATLDKFYDKGEITIDEYIELAPKNVVPFKEELKKIRQKKAMSMSSDMKEEVNNAMSNL